MARKLQLLKVYYLLDKLQLSRGELQSRTTVERVVKQGRKPRPGRDESLIDRRPIVRRVKVVHGTGIPASTLKKFQDRTITPRAASIKKLAKMYDRLQYQRLRAAGANYNDARRLKSYSPEKVQSFIANYIKNAKKIQSNYERTYIQSVKNYKKQERDKLKPSKKLPKKPPQKAPSVPAFDGTDDFEGPLVSQAKGDTETYLDEEEEYQESTYEEFAQPLPEPLPDDYPSLDEVIYGMSESEHSFNEWDDIADTSGLPK